LYEREVHAVDINVVRVLYVDIDECDMHRDICEQICNNMDGSFACSCDPGYVLLPDHRSCIKGNRDQLQHAGE